MAQTEQENTANKQAVEESSGQKPPKRSLRKNNKLYLPEQRFALKSNECVRSELSQLSELLTNIDEYNTKISSKIDRQIASLEKQIVTRERLTNNENAHPIANGKLETMELVQVNQGAVAKQRFQEELHMRRAVISEMDTSLEKNKSVVELLRRSSHSARMA